MSDVSPYMRRLVAVLGPLEEWRGQKEGTSIEIASDGSLNGLKMACSINKTVMGQPSPSTLSICNLARDTRDAIRSGLTKVTVHAGWANTEMHVAFQGAVMSALSERIGTDIVTTIQALPGYGALVRSVTMADGKITACAPAGIAQTSQGPIESRTPARNTLVGSNISLGDAEGGNGPDTIENTLQSRNGSFVTARGIDLDTHRHSGVQAGNLNTGGPTQ
ncbi:MAG: hypothetical protein LIP28_09610 [Deltaproteobacteria bacterium]|nr:hypothetical protein [Deltaproteobacteria bacterium]